MSPPLAILEEGARQALRMLTAPYLLVGVNGEVLWVDSGMARLLGRSATELVGRQIDTLAAMPPDLLRRQLGVFGGTTSWVLARLQLRGADGQSVEFPCRGLLLQSRHGERPGVICISLNERLQFQLLTRNIEAERALWERSNFDQLTGLPNRQMFQSRLEQEAFSGNRGSVGFALLFIDLDEFKDVNDTLGHEHGDLLLKEAAQRLHACVRRTDTVGRLGGDEFTVLLGNVRDRQRVSDVAAKILGELTRPFTINGQTSYVSASIGIACYPDDGSDGLQLLQHADQAMYAAKAAGRNCYRHFTSEMQEQMSSRLQIANDLRAALDGDQFELLYQPILHLPTQRLNRAEVLIRWRHPQRGNIPPGLFIPVAERTGLINRIDEWVFDAATRQLAEWRGGIAPDLTLSINISPLEFSLLAPGEQLTHWSVRLQQLGLPGSSIVLEITEGLLLDAGDRVSESLRKVAREGLQVPIDDFGTGYSSLAYLRRYDIDFLKIDQSFVQHIGHGDEGGTIVESVVAMAQKLGLEVVAEGVETEYQHRFLQNIGCNYGQGYFYAQPLPAAALIERIISANRIGVRRSASGVLA